jgi:hypothetical protein
MGVTAGLPSSACLILVRDKRFNSEWTGGISLPLRTASLTALRRLAGAGFTQCYFFGRALVLVWSASGSGDPRERAIPLL